MLEHNSVEDGENVIISCLFEVTGNAVHFYARLAHAHVCGMTSYMHVHVGVHGSTACLVCELCFCSLPPT